MCAIAAPVLTGLGAVSTLGGIGFNIFGAMQEQKAAAYNAQVARNNAITEGRAAHLQQRQFEIEERTASNAATQRADRTRVGNRSQLASLTNAVASRGITMSGSALDAATDTALALEMDAVDTEHEREKEGWQIRNQAAATRFNNTISINRSRAEATLARNRAKGAQMGVLGSLLGGAGTISGAYPRFAS